MSQPYTAPPPSEIAARQRRGAELDEKIRELRTANPALGYDEAFHAAKKALPQVVAAMQQPAAPIFQTGNAEGAPPWAKALVGSAATAPYEEHAPSEKEIREAGAKFSGLVEKAVHERGLSWEKAWNALQAEEPTLFAKMCFGTPGRARPHTA